MKNKKQMVLNLFFSAFAFAVGPGINMVMYPYIIKHVGVEAFGFAALAVSFTGYAQLAMVAIHSMAGRFMTVELHEGDVECANKYFNSVLITNITMAVLMLLAAVACIAYLEHIVRIPEKIIYDVKTLFAFVFAGFIVSILGNVFGIGLFASNRIDMASVRDIFGSIIRGGILFVLFFFFKPNIYYLGAATFVMNLFVFASDIVFTKTLLPSIKINWKFDLKSVFEIASSGAWNLLGRLSGILSQGIDLLIANIFVSPAAMGIISVSKTLPVMLINITGMFTGVFAPQLTISYAQKDFEDIKKQVFFSTKMLAMITGIPVAIITIYSADFYALWVPGQDARLLHILTVITIINLVITGPFGIFNNIFNAVNKIKLTSIVSFIQSIISAGIVIGSLYLIKEENSRMFIIVGVSSVMAILLHLTFLPVYAAKCLGFKWHTFFPLMFRNVVSFLILAAGLAGLRSLFIPDTWPILIGMCAAASAAGLMLYYLIIFSGYERKRIAELIMSRIIKENA